MSVLPEFPEAEFGARLAAVRERMAVRGIDVALVSTSENIFYLTGLDHWGYFAPHVLIVPHEGEMVLVTRAMERVTVANQVRNAAFHGHSDSETAADVVVRVMADRGQAKARSEAAAGVIAEVIEQHPEARPRLGVEKWSLGLPLGLAETLHEALEAVDWIDISGLIDDLRMVKSPLEQAYMRQSAIISDHAMLASIDAIADGVRERDIAADCHRAAIQAGGTFPGFGPFVRSTQRLGEEHTSWGDGVCRAGDAVFLELAGCYRRYHAPLGRLVFIGEAPEGSREMARICRDAFNASVAAFRPGVLAKDVYQAWQDVVDAADLAHYRRHHCGYAIGIGFPPSWSGGTRVTGLRHDSHLEIKAGMTWHMLSWLMGTGRGDYFISNTALVLEGGAEVLTKTPMTVIEK